jgi:hypothetical protein
MPREAASVGRLFSPLAKRFGNFEYSYASPTVGGRAYLFEYNLSGEQLGDWSRLVTIQFIPVDPAYALHKPMFPSQEMRETL